MIPPKLKKGDEIRVIAPSRSLAIITPDSRKLAVERLENLGLKVSFGKHVEECDRFMSSSIESRVEDLHAAFKDKNVKAILTVIGGFNCNQLLDSIDFDLIKKNPKIFCGFSDITALNNAIYAKTGLVTYSGPHYSTFGMRKGAEYIIDHFKKCFLSDAPMKVVPSKEWSDDKWYLDQEKRTFVRNQGYFPITTGTASGTVIGANLCTLQLLHGTKYMPSLKESVLFIEDDEMVGADFAVCFDRDLQSVIHQPGFSGVKGIVIGRAQKSVGMTNEIMAEIIRSKPALKGIPVVYGADFGHTSPMFTFPIGGKVKLDVKPSGTSIEFYEH